MATPLAPFYNQADQDIYEEGEHFIPQEYYRLNKFNNTVAPVPPEITQQTTQGSGIPYTNAFTNAGGGDGAVFSNTNKFGLDMDTLKNINQGKWASPGGPANMYGGEYINTPRQIAQDASGNWKDINTNQNVFHAGINLKTPATMILDKVFGKTTTDDPYKDSWYGHGEWDDEEMNIGTRRTIPQNIFTRWKEDRAIKREKRKEDDIAAHNQAAADEVRGLQVQQNIETYRDRKDKDRPDTGMNVAGGGKGQSPTGGNVGGTPFAQGGRIGFQPGGPAGGASAGGDYGGNVNPEQEYAGRTFEETYRGDNELSTDTPVIPPRDNFTVDTDFISKEPSIDATYSPAEWANIRARIFNKDITSEDDINFALSGEMGPFRADLDTSKDLRNISFNKDLGNFNLSGNTDLENYNLGIDYNRGPFFAGATTDNMGNTNFNVGAKWSWGGEPENYNTLSYQDQNPDLIYGQNLRYGGLASIL